MLKKIICDIFNEKEISFHNGLNVVCGDDAASNSIGKSNLLMIIDFVFGGEDYIHKNYDVVQNLGHHDFRYVFEFNNKEYFFIRNTNNYNFVSKCNQQFEVISMMQIDDYKLWLQKQYNCLLPGLTFRNIIGRYFRVYGKENLNEKKPIQYIEKERAQNSILYLIKLFNRYSALEDYEKQLKEIKDDKSILEGAVKKKYLPFVSTKKRFDENKKEIERIDFKLDEIKKEIQYSTIDLKSAISKEVMSLQIKKQELKKELDVYENRLLRTEKNIANNPVRINSELTKLKEYFPSFNIEKVNEVESFHMNIAKILNKEIEETKKEIYLNIDMIQQTIKSMDEKIEEKAKTKDISDTVFNELSELYTQKKLLEDANNNYIRKNDLTKTTKSYKKTYEEIREKTLDDICGLLNGEMYDLNKVIYNNQRKAPTLNIHGNNYSFNTSGDTGTGTAFANLISFDLAVLRLTCLPAIVHDLPLLKNIENNAMSNILALYYKEKEKQIFIAIDKINTYDQNAINIIKKAKVLELSKDKLLFIKNWKNNKL